MCFFFFELRILNDTFANFLVKDMPHVFWKYLFFFKGGSQKEKSQ